MTDRALARMSGELGKLYAATGRPSIAPERLLRDRAVAPHVSEYTKGKASLGKNALNEQERADPRRSMSQRKRKLIERVFAWGKLDRPLQQVKVRGLQRVDWFYRLGVTAHNLMRMGKLIPIPVQVG